ncbi:hypothetical protein L3Q82_002800 [Scortum barcoo]|uniref:Uncharacterized protein n=1 Tax=Scortum barcoo TaxID=214431 RepID=A0ACB8VU93_9TELE|nr:hypothetical protein L3Q82_002800 [Scortum barcoo]
MVTERESESIRKFVCEQLRDEPDLSTLTLGILKRRYLAQVRRDLLSPEAKSFMKQVVEEELIKMQENDENESDLETKKPKKPHNKRKRGKDESISGGEDEDESRAKKSRFRSSSLSESEEKNGSKTGSEESEAEEQVKSESEDEEQGVKEPQRKTNGKGRQQLNSEGSSDEEMNKSDKNGDESNGSSGDGSRETKKKIASAAKNGETRSSKTSPGKKTLQSDEESESESDSKPERSDKINDSSDDSEKEDKASVEKENNNPDSDSSSLPSIEDEQSHNSGTEKAEDNKKKKTTKKEEHTKSQKDDNKAVVRLKRYIGLCGVRRNYKKLLDGCRSVRSQVAVLKKELEDLGVHGPPSIEKCKKARMKREEAQELAGLDVSNIISTQGMDDDAPDEVFTEFKSRPLGGWGVAQIAAGTGLAVYAMWVGILQPGFRKVPLRLQVPYIAASKAQVGNVMTLLKGRKGGLVDLGSGDGRIVLEAHQQGFTPAIGYELNPWLIGLARFHAWRAGHHNKVAYRREDLWKVDLTECKNVTVFLAPSVASEEASLRALESLMTEFFHSCTTNERKREIEELLNNFAQQTGAWHHCLFFLSNTRNEYVMMYSLTVFENLVNKMWIGVASQDKMEIRSCLPKLLLAQHKSVPYFIRNKLCKVIVDIGRQDWPMFYHDFFTNTLQLIQSPALAPLGLVMLKTTSEELACPREDLSVARKEELRKLLQEQVPTVLGLLTGILETYWDKHSVIASTPPPSPTSGESVELLGNLFQGSQYSKLLCQPMATLDNESQQLCCLVLECLAHLFSWIPLSTSITPTLLASIFHFARFGCDIRTKAKTGSFNSSSSNGQLNPGTLPPTSNGGGRHIQQSEGSKVDRARLGVLAMTCVNELVSKNCVPMDFEEYLLRMFQQTFFLLQRLTRENNAHTVKSRLQDLDESYLEKFTDFLRLFVSVHLRRIESSPQFPIVEFLALLFKYTFNQPTHEGYFACLDIWSVFLDFLTTKIKSRLADRESVLNRYKDALVLLLREVLNRIQFRYNQAQLEELDDETLDDDVIILCLSFSLFIFSSKFPVLQENLDVYMGLQQFIVTTGTSRRLNISAENDCRRLHCSLRDLSSLLQAVGRLAEHFIGEIFAARFSDALAVVERLVEVTCYGSQTSLYDLETAVPSVLKPDLIDVHAQALAALQAYSHWLAQFYSEVHSQNQTQFITLITSAIDASCPLITAKVPEKLLLSSCHLMVSLTSTVRPVFLVTLPAVQNIFNLITTENQTRRLPQEAHMLVCRALSNMLLLPWPNLPENEQQWPTRSSNHENLIAALTREYRILRGTVNITPRQPDLDNMKAVIQQTLPVLRDIVDSISGESTKSRQICYQSLQESVQVSLSLFPVFIQQPDVTDEMLAFFLTLFQALRVQMGVAFTGQIIHTFLSMFTREQLAASILQEGSAGCRVVQKFLKILQVVVQEPGQAFKPFLPSILSLCMEQVYPIVAEAFGQSFLQPDIHIFKQNLSYLESLNSKHKLYHRKLFRTSMLFHFINVLLQVLLHKSHDLLQEEITVAIYNMASVDFDAFYSAFMPEFLNGCQGVDTSQRAALARNFKLEQGIPPILYLKKTLSVITVE